MRLGRLLVFVVLLHAAPHALAAQAPADFKAAYDANRIFALRDAVLGASAPPLYRGAVSSSANRVTAAERELKSIIRQRPHSSEAYEAHDLLGNMYFRNGMYREGYREIVAALQERPNASDAKSMLPIFTALNAQPRMKLVASRPSSIPIEPGELFLPLRADGKDLSFFFDTGANISVIGASTAKELGLPLSTVEGKMGDASGQGVSGLQLTLVSDLQIAGFHFRNVPFVVLADTGEPWIHLPKNKHGILGLPLLLALRTIRWSPAGKFEAGFPSRPYDLRTCNLLFRNSNPVVDVLVEEQHLAFTLDTGAVDTDLNPAFAHALPSLMLSGVKKKHSIEGLGGKVEQDAVILPSVKLRLAGKELMLQQAHVFPEHGNGTWAAGNLGMDLLRQARAFTLDFGAMTLQLQ